MTVTKTKFLTFDETTWHKPVVCTLAKKFDVEFSIMKAKVLPRRVGLLVLELSGEQAAVDQAVDFLEEQGVGILGMEQEILYDQDVCTQCGSCTGFCPSDALTLKEGGENEVIFIPERCIGCELCLIACPAHALSPSTELSEFGNFGRTH